MFLKNWYSLLGALFRNDGDSITTTSNHSGTVSNSNIPSLLKMHAQMNYLLPTGSGNGIVIGDGDVPPAYDDYALSGNVLTGYTYSAAVTRSDDVDGSTLVATYTITNTGEADMTIKEIGYLTAHGPSLHERTVLDSPVTIPAGGVGQVTYTIRMNYPTA